MRCISNFTKKAIKQTFIALLNKKPLPQITVKDIVEECGINRNSFYYHFQDIPTLIDELITEETDRLIVDYSPLDPLETWLTNAIHAAMDLRETILNIYRYMDRSVFESYLWRICDKIISAYTKNELTKTSFSEKDREIIEHLFRCECFGFLIEWLNGEMTDYSDEVIARFCRIHRGMLAESDRSCSNEKNIRSV